MKKSVDQINTNRDIKLTTFKNENRPIQKVEPVIPTTKKFDSHDEISLKVDTKVSKT